jgi:hypothetical protein
MNVRETIVAAFANTPHPGDDNITSPKGNDEGTEEYFRGRTWRGHTPRDLRLHSSALSFFTPAAFRYFLPAFLLAEIDDPETADIIAESIAFHFTRALGRDARLPLFSTQELAAIAAFFDECALRYPSFAYNWHFAADEVRRSMHET